MSPSIFKKIIARPDAIRLISDQAEVSQTTTKSRGEKVGRRLNASKGLASQVDLDALNRAKTFSEYFELCIENRLKKKIA